MKVFCHYRAAITRTAYALALGGFASVEVYADKNARDIGSDLPSAEFLEFFAEFSETDDETFALILHHGKQDSELQEMEKTIGREGSKERESDSNDEV